MLGSVVSCQDTPFQSSTSFLPGEPAGALPPTAIAAVYVPIPLSPPLEELILFNSVQDEPLNCSVLAVVPGSKLPPKAKAAVAIPLQPGYPRAVPKSPVSAHDVPFQTSV